MQKADLRDIFKISNLITSSRIILALIIFSLLCFNFQTDLIKWIFLLGVITDTLDGSLARSLKQITRLGVVLEPIADTLLVFSTVLFVAFYLDFPRLIFIIYLIIFFVGLFNLIAIYLTKRKWFAEKLVISEVSIFFIYGTGIFYLFGLPGKIYLAIFSVILGMISLVDFLVHLFKFNKKIKVS
jgi:phosphatidylglycerophosphate synthase